MNLAIVIVVSVLAMGVVYAVVIRGSLGLVKKRLEESPDLAKVVPDSKLEIGVPVDVEY